jgi:hypothetical protein
MRGASGANRWAGAAGRPESAVVWGSGDHDRRQAGTGPQSKPTPSAATSGQALKSHVLVLSTRLDVPHHPSSGNATTPGPDAAPPGPAAHHHHHADERQGSTLSRTGEYYAIRTETFGSLVLRARRRGTPNEASSRVVGASAGALAGFICRVFPRAVVGWMDRCPWRTTRARPDKVRDGAGAPSTYRAMLSGKTVLLLY